MYVDPTKVIPTIDHASLTKEEKHARKKVYEALKRAQEVFVERYTFNTMIAGVMEAMNALNEQTNRDVWSEGYWILTSIMEPIIPHLCWELSSTLFGRANLTQHVILDEVFDVESLILGVSVNGKNRATIEVAVGASEAEMIALATAAVEKWLKDKTIVKTIIVPTKLVNIVIKG
jgi:leucyl-tRNA synthetase